MAKTFGDPSLPIDIYQENVLIGTRIIRAVYEDGEHIGDYYEDSFPNEQDQINYGSVILTEHDGHLEPQSEHDNALIYPFIAGGMWIWIYIILILR